MVVLHCQDSLSLSIFIYKVAISLASLLTSHGCNWSNQRYLSLCFEIHQIHTLKDYLIKCLSSNWQNFLFYSVTFLIPHSSYYTLFLRELLWVPWLMTPYIYGIYVKRDLPYYIHLNFAGKGKNFLSYFMYMLFYTSWNFFWIFFNFLCMWWILCAI